MKGYSTTQNSLTNKSRASVWATSTQYRRSHNGNVKDYYKVLGVKRTAELKEIKDAFYELSKKYHPDVNQEEGTLVKFREVAEAYDILSNSIERKAYDISLGPSDTSDNKKASSLKRTGRRFTGMHGEFVNGEFVDDEKAPEHRTIHYDLSPERMNKIWERYQTRWNRPEEIERRQNLKTKKEQFRRDIDMRRAQMYSMSEEEREDFKHKMRIFSPNAGKVDADRKVSSKKSNSYAHDFEKQEELKEKIKKQETATKNREDRERLFKEEIKNWEEEMKAYNIEQETIKEAKHRKSLLEEDPLTQGERDSRRGNEATGYMSFVTMGMKRTKQQFSEMSEAQPFSHTQSSVKHGIFHVQTVRVGKVALSIISHIIIFFSLAEYSNYYDETDAVLA